MDTEKKVLYFRVALILIGWAGICFLLYYFVFSSTPETVTKPKKKVEQPKKNLPLVQSPPTVQQPKEDSFQQSFTESEIKEAKKVIDQFIDVIYEGERSSRDSFVNQLQPYTTTSYLEMYKQANGLGETITIKEKYINYVEHGNSIPEGTIVFNCTVLTEKGDYFSTMYFLVKESGTWRVTEEADGLVPED